MVRAHSIVLLSLFISVGAVHERNLRDDNVAAANASTSVGATSVVVPTVGVANVTGTSGMSTLAAAVAATADGHHDVASVDDAHVHGALDIRSSFLDDYVADHDEDEDEDEYEDGEDDYGEDEDEDEDGEDDDHDEDEDEDGEDDHDDDEDDEIEDEDDSEMQNSTDDGVDDDFDLDDVAEIYSSFLEEFDDDEEGNDDDEHGEEDYVNGDDDGNDVDDEMDYVIDDDLVDDDDDDLDGDDDDDVDFEDEPDEINKQVDEDSALDEEKDDIVKGFTYSSDVPFVDISGKDSVSAKVKSEGKPGMVLVTNSTCPTCKFFVESINSNAKVKADMKKFVAVSAVDSAGDEWKADGESNYWPRVYFVKEDGSFHKVPTADSKYPHAFFNALELDKAMHYVLHAK